MNAIANTANRATWFALGVSVTLNIAAVATVLGCGYILTDREDKIKIRETLRNNPTD